MEAKVKTSGQKSTQKNGRTLPICSIARGNEPAPVKGSEAGQSDTPGCGDLAPASRILVVRPVVTIRFRSV
jgi:hypothetical protein